MPIDLLFAAPPSPSPRQEAVHTAIVVLVETTAAAAFVMGATAWRHTTRSIRLTTIALLCMVTTDIVLFTIAQRANNHWVIYASTPIWSSLILASFAEWQVSRRARRLVYSLIPAFLLLWLVGVIWFEDIRQFSNWVSPIHRLGLAAAAAFTIYSRALTENEPVVSQAWFWICAGWLTYYASNVVFGPVSNLLIGSQFQWALVVSFVRSAFVAVAYILVAFGMYRAHRAAWGTPMPHESPTATLFS